MSTKQSANVWIQSNANGNVLIQLYHNNKSYGTQEGVWMAGPKQTVGPLTVYFDTGGDTGLLWDYWSVRLTVYPGPKGTQTGIYNNAGTVGTLQGWKECQLGKNDAGKSLTFSVDTNTFNINVDSKCTDAMSNIGPYNTNHLKNNINHVFVLMLENHSFDNIFAFSGIPGIKAATTSNKNSHNRQDYLVQRGAPTSMSTDPGHEFLDTVQQLCGQYAVWDHNLIYPPSINNSGFAANYATTTSEGPVVPSLDHIGDIMKCFDTPRQLPVIYQLATEFAICDHWFSSMPGPTWPNRFFLHGASSAGWDDSPSQDDMKRWEVPTQGFTYPNGSIFDSMNNAKVSWRIYNDTNGPKLGGIPQVSALKGLSLGTSYSFDRFASDLQNPFYPYQYTFIEPNYGDVTGNYTGGSSQHPMDGVARGEGLIKATYEAIRNSPLWYSSLLIITYDEHGGFYDSVGPDFATAPGDGKSGNKNGFTFQQYGVRVPAVIISPWIDSGTVDHTVYDHTSVLKTLEKLFNLPSLTERDKGAHEVLKNLSLEVPRMDCSTQLNNPASTPMAEAAEQAVPAETMGPAADLQPLPDSGNTIGFLHILLKTDLELLELSGGTEEEKNEIIERFKGIKTRGAARRYGEEVFAKLEAVQAAGMNSTSGTPPEESAVTAE